MQWAPLLMPLLGCCLCGDQQSNPHSHTFARVRCSRSPLLASSRLCPPMERLATVELQLVMHNLDAASLLALARCSRHTLRAADAPFAWQRTLRSTSFWMEIDEPEPDWMMDWSEEQKEEYKREEREQRKRDHPEDIKAETIASPPAKSLLRHAPISLSWGSFWSESIHVATDIDVGRLLAAIPAGAAVHELHTPRCLQLTRSHWIRILTHPAIRQLRTLRRHSGQNDPTESVDAVSDVEMLSLIAAHLPHLRTLHMDPFLSWADTGALWLLEITPEAAQRRAPGHAPAVQPTAAADDVHSEGSDAGNCALRHLIVDQPRLYGSMFLEFFLSSHLRSLHTLTLTLLHAAGSMPSLLPISAEDYAAAFSALAQLHTLTLAGVLDIDAILPHVARAPRLRWLTVQQVHGSHCGDRCVLPSEPILRQLLETAPRLQLTLLTLADERARFKDLMRLFAARLEMKMKIV